VLLWITNGGKPTGRPTAQVPASRPRELKSENWANLTGNGTSFASVGGAGPEQHRQGAAPLHSGAGVKRLRPHPGIATILTGEYQHQVGSEHGGGALYLRRVGHAAAQAVAGQRAERPVALHGHRHHHRRTGPAISPTRATASMMTGWTAPFTARAGRVGFPRFLGGLVTWRR
jgi:hypothetical protein